MEKEGLATYDIVISGGGMVGMTLAVALARDGLRIALLEKTKISSQLDASFDGRVSAIALGSKYILENIGVWQHVIKEAESILDIRVSDGNTPVFLHYNPHEVNEDNFGYIVENRYIRHALHEAASQQKSLTILDEATIQEVETGVSNVQLKTTRGDISCRLLVSAEGKNSPLRKQAGINAVEWNYPQTAIVCTIQHEKPHGGLAQERFLPAGPFAVLPMTGNRSSLVWVEPNDRVNLYLELPDAEFVQEIAERVGNYLGTISIAGKRFSYPLSLMHASTYIGKRLALIGDAAHAIHPIAGQGVNLGFRDVAVLHELILDRFKTGLDIGSDDMLEHYQRWRRFDNVAMMTATDGLNRLFSNNIPPVRAARDMGLWLVGKMPPLKRIFMRHAMGLTGDIPALSRKAG